VPVSSGTHDGLIKNSVVKPGGSQSLDGFVHVRGVIDVEYSNNSHHSRPRARCKNAPTVYRSGQ